jgi:hypothetical protein
MKAPATPACLAHGARCGALQENSVSTEAASTVS